MSRARRLAGMPSIGVDAMGKAADAADDPRILRLENLDTDLRPPSAALAASHQALEEDAANSYLPFLGQLPLRQTVAGHVGALSGQRYDGESEVIITAGGLNGCMVTLNALIDPGDEVLVTDPTYIGMLNRIRISGGVPVAVPFRWESSGWRLDLDALRKALTPRLKALFIMSPSMPSGALLNREEWEALCAVCRERQLPLIYNAAMERIIYDDGAYLHPASLPGMRELTITVGSASKELRMIGWRVGWVVGPEAIMGDVGLVSISDVVVPVGIAQAAAEAALSAPAADLAEALAEWQRRRDRLREELLGLPFRTPAGGWSALFDAGAVGLSGAELSRRLLEAGVAATAMDNWGVVHGAQHLRFVFSNEPVPRLQGLGARLRGCLP